MIWPELTENFILSLHQKLTDHFNTFPLNVAGRLIYFDKTMCAFILGVHTTGAEKTFEVASEAWKGLSSNFKEELVSNKIGFAVRQI